MESQVSIFAAPSCSRNEAGTYLVNQTCAHSFDVIGVKRRVCKREAGGRQKSSVFNTRGCSEFLRIGRRGGLSTLV